MAVAQDATGVPREWLVQLGGGWYAFVGTSCAAFALATAYACSQFLHRTLELSRAAKRSRSVASRSGGCTTEYRRLMMGLSVVALALRTLWHLDPASVEGVLPVAVSFLLLRVPQCVLFLQALFVVAFTRRFTVSMLKLARIKSKITVGRYKYVFAIVAILLVAAISCGFVGSLGIQAVPLHLAEQGIFASVGVFTTAAGFVFARGFRAATSTTGSPSPIGLRTPLPPRQGSAKGLPASSPGAKRSDGDTPAPPTAATAGAEALPVAAEVDSGTGTGTGSLSNPILRLTNSFRVSIRSSVGIFSSVSGSGFGSVSSRQAGTGQSLRSLRGSKMAAQMQGAVFVGIAGAVGMGAALAWSVVSGLQSPGEWLAFTAVFRALELLLASAALYTVASGRNRLARPVCPYSLLDFAFCVWSFATAADAAKAETAALTAVRQVVEPVTGLSLEQVGMDVSVRAKGASLPSASSAGAGNRASSLVASIELASGAYPERPALEAAVKGALASVPGVPPSTSVEVQMRLRAPRARPHVTELRRRATMVTDGLSEVTSIIGVSSCKGGVGKSTVALNLAYSLAEMGGRVGLFDADVYGPSLPSLVQPEDTTVVRLADKGWLRPLSHHGVRLMSYGWVAPRGDDGERGGAAMRGPMASSVVQQLSQLTDWGPLDVLVVDMPPGTGDVVITLGQKLALAGAVIVTTPHPLARVDVRKGVELFQRMRVPSLALVNNMSYLRPSATAPAVHPFGRAEEEVSDLQARFDIPAAASIPLDAVLGTAPAVWPYRSPSVLDQTGEGSSRPFAELADSLARELMRREHSAAIKARRAEEAREGESEGAVGRGVSFVGGAGGIEVGIASGGRSLVVRAFRDDGAEQHTVTAAAARRASLAADAGAAEDVDEGVSALACTAEGNYAVTVRFSDGHEAILPLEELLRLGRGE